MAYNDIKKIFRLKNIVTVYDDNDIIKNITVGRIAKWYGDIFFKRRHM